MGNHTCPRCGTLVLCDAPRHAPRGSGAHYAEQIVKLTPGHKLALEVLEKKPGQMATLTDLWITARNKCMDEGRAIPTKQGLSGRLSELQGMGRVSSIYPEIQLVNKAGMQYRSRKTPVWVLVTTRSPETPDQKPTSPTESHTPGNG